MKTKTTRRQSGSMLVLFISILIIVIVPCIILFCQLAPFMLSRGKAQNVIDAAALLAARDLSCIVINDPCFGYISLSNHPAKGLATRAADGEPLPVTGINTLLGTLHELAQVAEKLHNDRMNFLLDQDLRSLNSTLKNLNSSLSASLTQSHATCVDMDGKTVNPMADVSKFLEENLPSNLKVESLKISTGWLDSESETTVSLPTPSQKNVSPELPAFKNIIVGSHSFNYAGLGIQPHLVSARHFKEADNKHICSIIRIDCTLSSNDANHTKSEYTVCCQPCSAPDQSAAGAMTVRFAGTPQAGLLSLRECLSPTFQDNKITRYDIGGGDFPFDLNARMYRSQQEIQGSTAEEFAEHIYCWLRTLHTRARLDSIIAALNEPFNSGSNQIYTYQLAHDGTVSRNVLSSNGFTRAVTADGQMAAMADTRIKSGHNAIIYFRDNVRWQGVHNGKHAGQPLAGYPLAAMDLWFDQNQLADKFSKRTGNRTGLALDIEIAINSESAASRDILSMRQKTLHRKV